MAYQGNYPPSTPLTSSQIAAGAVQPSNLSSIGPSWDGSGNLSVLGSSGSSSNRLSFTYNGSSGEATVGPNSTGGTTFLTFGTSSSGTYSERMRIDSSGNVGIGTSSPSSPFQVHRDSVSFVNIKVSNSVTGSGSLDGVDLVCGTSGEAYLYNRENQPLIFGTNNTERARITSNGQFLVNQTSGNNGRLSVFTSTTGDNLIEARSTASGLTHLLVNTTLSSAGGSDALGVYDASGISARITTNGFYQSRPNSYGSTSDERLKENIVDATPKLADIMQVRVRNYNYKDQPGDKQLGVIAQELETVFPGLVHEIPNANPELASTETVKSVKYSVFVPMLIKAIQELSAKNDALEARLAALEAK